MGQKENFNKKNVINNNNFYSNTIVTQKLSTLENSNTWLVARNRWATVKQLIQNHTWIWIA